MPVEIREIVIKTEVRQQGTRGKSYMSEAFLQELRAEVLSDCKRIISKKIKERKSRR